MAWAAAQAMFVATTRYRGRRLTWQPLAACSHCLVVTFYFWHTAQWQGGTFCRQPARAPFS